MDDLVRETSITTGQQINTQSLVLKYFIKIDNLDAIALNAISEPV